MQQLAAVRSVKQAVRMIKHMDVQGPEWAGIQQDQLRAVKAVLEDRMQHRVGNYLADLAAHGVADRRNGSYRRHLLCRLDKGHASGHLPHRRSAVK